MEEQILRCNVQSQTRGCCRAQLKQSAIVTTCSHVICRPCAQETGFLQASPTQRQCPACKTPLSKLDDVAEAILSPLDEYKTTVLCGLDPQTIMECASRALSFWNYQALQETAYQKHLLHMSTQNYAQLDTENDRLVNESNATMKNLHNKITSLTNEMHQRNADYVKKDRERRKKYSNLHNMYERLKQKYQAIQQQGTASAGAKQAIQNLTEGMLPVAQSPYQKGGVLATTNPSTYFADRKPHNLQNAENLHQLQYTGSINPSTTQSKGRPPPQMVPVRGGTSPIRVSSMQRDVQTQAMRFVSDKLGSLPQNVQQFYASPKADTLSNRQQPNARPKSISGTPNRYGGLSAGMKTGSACTLDSQKAHFTDHRRPRSRGASVYQHRPTGSLSTNGVFQ